MPENEYKISYQSNSDVHEQQSFQTILSELSQHLVASTNGPIIVVSTITICAGRLSFTSYNLNFRPFLLPKITPNKFIIVQ